MTATAAVTAGGEPLNLAARLEASNVHAVLDELDRELVGLEAVKRRIAEIASYLLVSRVREERGLAAEAPTLHMCFAGPPGTGKTTVATRVATILHRLGYVARDHVVVATREDLVGQFVGHTAPRTREALKKASGGVLFIDEAYALYRPESERDYGPEAIEILLQAMEARRNDPVVVLAGYDDRMAAFFDANPGFRSRIAHHIRFPDFGPEELLSIAERMLARQGYAFDAASRAAFEEYLGRRARQPHFANARSVRNALDRMKLRHAARLVRTDRPVDPAELGRIDEADVRASAVFRTEVLPAPADDHPAAGAETDARRRGRVVRTGGRDRRHRDEEAR